MKKTLTAVVSSLIAGATFMMAAAPAAAVNVDVHLGTPGVVVQQPVYVQPRPVYIQERYESDWRERQIRATEWRKNHGQAVSAAAHARNEDRKHDKKHSKGHRKNKNKHGH